MIEFATIQDKKELSDLWQITFLEDFQVIEKFFQRTTYKHRVCLLLPLMNFLGSSARKTNTHVFIELCCNVKK